MTVSFMEWVRQNHAKQPDLGAELRAMAREMAKDVRSKVMETFFGSAELGGEMGTPLNPTPQMTTQDLGTVNRDALDTGGLSR